MKQLFLTTLVAAVLLAGCTTKDGGPDKGDREALAQYMATYPEAHLQDIYKSCFQNVFGVAHLISDTQACINYIESEMEELDPDDRDYSLYEYTLPDSHYVRVDLHAVAEGLVPCDLLVELLMTSAATPAPLTQEEWVARWQELKAAADALDPRPDDYEKEAAEIDSLLAEGRYVWHHSRHFGEVYRPHYRLVRRDLFESRILPLL